ncbi:Gfo/Idh/MocA family oxidoreductase [Stieleria sp. TO1_6]|uniref:Gfo/Idh/MocA family protein n=1 Tax=Stieleria tagensis TaxID=2956795 RepID=UPI00209AFBA0|nr:Gfo/Idh/MocA family oxidoreductase [Stieleria tagensis]MCO8121262.1 Gfo/Idh/MocA family oxidoreductase [Stieleria tagensis]
MKQTHDQRLSGFATARLNRRQFAALSAASTGWLAADSKADDTGTVKVAVIGHTGRGDYGHGLDTVWNRVPVAKIVGLADANKSGLAKHLDRLKLDSSVGHVDYREMLANNHFDIVAVCPRHPDQHEDMILAAIESGAKGIYVEKPFVRTPAEADRVLAAATQHNTKLAVAHRNRYHPVLKTISDLIQQGRIGRLLEIRGRGKGDRRGGAEDLWVLGSHVLNLVAYFGGRPLSCSAVMLRDGRKVTRNDVVDGNEGLGPLAGNELHARFQMETGVTAYFDSIANDGTQNQGFGLQLIGSEGVIALHIDALPLAHLRAGNPFDAANAAPWIPITSGGVNVPEPLANLSRDLPHHVVAANDLIAAIREDRDPLCSATEAALTVEMICSVFESHRRGGLSVSLPLADRDHPLKKL